MFTTRNCQNFAVTPSPKIAPMLIPEQNHILLLRFNCYNRGHARRMRSARYEKTREPSTRRVASRCIFAAIQKCSLHL
jgi:hypothetical protein